MDEYVILDDDYRNAPMVIDHRRHRPLPAVRPNPPIYNRPQVVYQPAPAPQVIYQPAPAPPAASPPPAISPFTGSLRWGVVADAAAQAFSALQPLPPPPSMTENANTNFERLVQYQTAIAEHNRRQVQVRAIGAIARAFMG